MDTREKGQGFLSRWSQRKLDAREQPVARPAEAASNEAPPPDAAPGPGPQSDVTNPGPVGQDPVPTMEDVERLTPDADFSRFVNANVEPAVRNAALKKLFSDPHFNVMDRLDTYIDDYNAPDPLPAALLRKMAQARFLGLLSERDKPEQEVTHEDADLQLQPDDASGRDGAQSGAEPDARREP